MDMDDNTGIPDSYRVAADELRAWRLRDLGFVPQRSLWELDHIVPLVDGGSHDLDNLQTLCTPCHKAKTVSEASERRERCSRSAEDDVIARADAALRKSEEMLAQLEAQH